MLFLLAATAVVVFVTAVAAAILVVIVLFALPRLSRQALARAIQVAGTEAAPSPTKAAQASSSPKKEAAAAGNADASADAEQDARFVHISLNAENLLLRGSVVRNTAFAFGIVPPACLTPCQSL